MRQDTLDKLAKDTIALLEKDGMKAVSRYTRQGTSAPLRHGGERYQGGNAFALWATAQVKGYTSPYWMTFKQALAFDACVRKGETGTPICFFDRVPGKKGEAGDGSDDKAGFGFMKAYTVFNAAQIDNLPARFYPAVVSGPVGFWDGVPVADAFVAATGAKVVEGAPTPCYRPSRDEIGMPPRDAYPEPSGYYGDLFHELIHWTATDARTGRGLGKRFSGPDADKYALEEMVAELGAAILCGELGLVKDPRDDHAPYLAHWLKALKSDPKVLWTAASAADKAADFLLAMQPAAAAPVALVA